jgi:cytochrome c2
VLRIRYTVAARILGAALLVAAGAPMAQTNGDSTAGQQLFTATLSPPCEGCHSTTSSAAANSLTSIRNNITNRATLAGAAGTMSFAKALEALNAALNGSTLGGAVTGMSVLFPALTTTQRGDLAAYIAGLAGPAPSLRYSPASGPIFAATAVGATASSTVTISNVGTADLVFVTNNAVTIATGGDAADFRVTASTCPGVTLPPNSGNCTVNVTFTPAAGASLTRTASIGLTATNGTTLVPLAGSVVAAAPPSADSAANAPSSGGGGSVELVCMVALLGLLTRLGARDSGDRRNPAARGLFFRSANPPDDRDAFVKSSTKEIE